MDILIISPRPALWEALRPAFEEQGAALRLASGMDDALTSLRERKASLALLDLFGGEAWSDDKAETLRKAVIAILMADASINLASSCGMGHDTFHSAMEGLGMIDDLPAQPEASHISALLTAHKTILGLLA
jgi:DNA-binding NtrC family response regulator